MRIDGKARGYDAEIAILSKVSKRLWVKLRKTLLKSRYKRYRIGGLASW